MYRCLFPSLFYQLYTRPEMFMKMKTRVGESRVANFGELAKTRKAEQNGPDPYFGHTSLFHEVCKLRPEDDKAYSNVQTLSLTREALETVRGFCPDFYKRLFDFCENAILQYSAGALQSDRASFFEIPPEAAVFNKLSATISLNSLLSAAGAQSYGCQVRTLTHPFVVFFLLSVMVDGRQLHGPQSNPIVVNPLFHPTMLPSYDSWRQFTRWYFNCNDSSNVE